jgi:hypothetical protein
MIQVRYTGLVDPRASFDALRPYRRQLIAMMMRHRPFGPDYKVLYDAQKALDTAAAHFTGDPAFYSLQPPKT